MQHQHVHPEPLIDDLKSKLMSNISLQLWLIGLLQDGGCDEYQFIRMSKSYEDETESLMKQHETMLKNARDMSPLEKALKEVKVYYEELKMKKEIGAISEEEYRVKARLFEWEISNYEKEISSRKTKIKLLEEPSQKMSQEKIIRMKQKIEDYKRVINNPESLREINPNTINLVKGALDKFSTYFEEIKPMYQQPLTKSPVITEKKIDKQNWIIPKIKKTEIEEQKILDSVDIKVEEADWNIHEIEEIKVEPQKFHVDIEKETETKKPQIIRIECPYDNMKGGKCEVIAFGKTEIDAYRKLESHIKKHHSKRLEEFKKEYFQS